jgi:hypothetical protein
MTGKLSAEERRVKQKVRENTHCVKTRTVLQCVSSVTHGCSRGVLGEFPNSFELPNSAN